MKKSLYLFVIFFIIGILSGCSLPGTSSKSGENIASMLISEDGGENWRIVQNGEQKILSSSILGIKTDPSNSDIVYAGLEKQGILKSEDGGKSWNFLNFQSEKVYGLAIDPANTQIVYASGVWQGRGKIFKSLDRGENWKEVYTMPADGPLIISLVVARNNTDVLYAGSSEGQVIKTTDGGDTWEKVFTGRDPVIGLAIDSFNDNLIYMTTTRPESFVSSDGGETFSPMADSIKESTSKRDSFEIVETDPGNRNWVYLAGEGGLILSHDRGGSWEEINALSNTENFPIRSLGINPWNSKEIIYGSAKALYKSVNGGETWSSSQFETDNLIRDIEYDSFNPSMIYVGFSEK